jgi:hypothetical protein
MSATDIAFSHVPLSVFDPLKDVDELTDRHAVHVIADQLNDPTQNQNRQKGAAKIEDLSSRVIDVTFDSVGQGAGTLEIDVTDTTFELFTRANGKPAFIDVDDSGLLIPVDVNFPINTDRWWRLAQVTTTVDPAQPQQLVFEDLIVTLLRDQGGPRHAGSNQTRAQFIYSLVKSVPQIRFVCPALYQKAGAVAGDVTEAAAEKLVDGTDTTGIIAPSTSAVAKSAKNKDAPSARRNPAKRPGITKQTAAAAKTLAGKLIDIPPGN